MRAPTLLADQGNTWLIFLAAAFFLLALAILWLTAKQRKSLGLPVGKIITADTRHWEPLQQALYDPQTGLTGRPDYLLQHAGKLIPVEVKSQQVDAGPYDSHIFQLAAYCLLVDRQYKNRPGFGILHYPNRTYEIEFTPQLEAKLIILLEEMRKKRKSPDRSHDMPRRCQGCGYRATCDQRLL